MRQEAPSTTGKIAPEAWRALDDAARRDGLPLDQWLRARLMGTTAAGTPPAELDGLNNLAELRRRIEELAGQIGRIDAPAPPEPEANRASEPEANRVAEPQATRTSEPRAARPLTPPQAPDERGSSDDRLAAAMREIDQRLAALQLSRRRAATPEDAPSPAAIEAAVAEIAARQSELDYEMAPRRLPEADALAPLAPGRLGANVFTPPPPSTGAARPAPLPAEALLPLQDELAGLRRAVATLAPRQSVDELQRVVQQLVTRVEHSETRDEHLRATLASLREMIGGLRLPEPPEFVLGRIAALERKIDIVNAKVVDGATVARLQAQVAEIRELLARALSTDALRLLAEQVSLLATRVAEMATRESETVRTAFGALERRLDTLAERVAAPLPLDDLLARLEAIQHDLASARQHLPPGLEALFKGLSDRLERIERPAAPPDDGARFEALGRQIEEVSHRLGAIGAEAGGERAEQIASQLASIERAVNDLFIQMEETRASLLAAARPRPPAGGGDAETLTALIRREIAALETQRATESATARATAAAAAEAAVAAELASLAAASRPAPPEAIPSEPPPAPAPEPAAVFTPPPASIPKAFEPQLMRAALEALSRTAISSRRAPATPAAPMTKEAEGPALPPAAANDTATSRATLIAQARRAASPTERPAAPRPAPAAPVELRSHIGRRVAARPGRWLARIRAMLVIAVCGSALAYGSWHVLAQLRQEQLRAAGPASVPGPEDITGSVGGSAPRAPAPPSNLIFSR
ncbi:hypothetical protein [Ancylobacter sp. IITR112]|uniref:hypothetical protein n=1 Tax=Ancylobacter sp. IITR112 TaxID=3138073 RepID=UPI00352B0901